MAKNGLMIHCSVSKLDIYDRPDSMRAGQAEAGVYLSLSPMYRPSPDIKLRISHEEWYAINPTSGFPKFINLTIQVEEKEPAHPKDELPFQYAHQGQGYGRVNPKCHAFREREVITYTCEHCGISFVWSSK